MRQYFQVFRDEDIVLVYCERVEDYTRLGEEKSYQKLSRSEAIKQARAMKEVIFPAQYIGEPIPRPGYDGWTVDSRILSRV